MKSLLIAVAVIAALCVVSFAASGQDDVFSTSPAPQASPPAGDVFSTPRGIPEEDASNEELRQEYLRVLEERSREMSEAELEAAINEAKAERHWNNAAAKLTEAAKELGKISKDYPRTRYASTAGHILGVLQSAGIDIGQPRGVQDPFAAPF